MQASSMACSLRSCPGSTENLLAPGNGPIAKFEGRCTAVIMQTLDSSSFYFVFTYVVYTTRILGTGYVNFAISLSVNVQVFKRPQLIWRPNKLEN